MKIYNKSALTRNQRFVKAVLYGIPATLVIAIVLGFLLNIMPIQFEIMFLGVGYAIGYVIRTYGRGVQTRFSILGAVLCAVAIILADAMAIGGIWGMLNPYLWMISVMNYFSSLTSLWGILGLVFRIGAVATAYEQSRIV
ncbi:MAG: hypothetical protein E7191_03415 [Erysipelotrichaceae bacterium]|nr:hypothetical protein [Erysipelotrichaceae bacterium]MBQ9988058.1 hypothetical protein [Erysipelotrichales bacterium]